MQIPESLLRVFFLLNVEINQGITLVFGFTNGLRYAEYMKTYW